MIRKYEGEATKSYGVPPQPNGANARMFSKEEIEGWLRELGEFCMSPKTEWQFPYKLGYTNGLTAVMIKMDDELRKRKQSHD
jgi:hypothetical protein